MIRRGTGCAGSGAAAAARRLLRGLLAAGTLALSGMLLPHAPAAAQEANAVRSLSGELPVGGRFLMAIPDDWQPGDGLIIYNHGFSLVDAHLESDPSLAPDDTVLVGWLQRGYAVIAGTYAQRGWAVFSLATFQRQLLQRFVSEAGQPGRILLVGGSFGGLVAVKTAEYLVSDGQPVAGVLSLCAPLAGARTWDRAADLKLAYDAVCRGVGGGEIDRGSPEPGWVMGYGQIPPDWGDLNNEEVQRLGGRLAQCTGVFLPEVVRSSGMDARLATLVGSQGIDISGPGGEDRFIVNMSYASFALADLVRGPDKLRGFSPFDNVGIDYGEGVVDVERVVADPFARAELSVLSDPSWRLGDAHLLALHTSGDAIVVPEHLSELREPMQDNDRIAAALVLEETPSHCEFEAPEFAAAFAALEAWIDGAAAPTHASLDAQCEGLVGAMGGSCRFADPSALADYDARVPPRQLAVHAEVAPPQSGAWYDPATDGEGFFVHVLPDGRHAAVAWYTYAPDGSGEQRWITGVGLVQDNAILVQDAMLNSGGGFGTAFDPATVQQTRFGQLTFVVEEVRPGEPDLRSGRVRYEGPAEWGTGVRELVQLTHDGCGVDAAGCSAAALALHAYSGLWFRGNDAPGDGLFLQVDEQGLAVIAWYLFLPDGTPMWLIGTQAVSGDPDQVQFTLERATGARFGEAFDPDEVVRSTWGTATLSFQSCAAATLSWDANDPALADGTIALERLTAAPGGSACAD